MQFPRPVAFNHERLEPSLLALSPTGRGDIAESAASFRHPDLSISNIYYGLHHNNKFALFRTIGQLDRARGYCGSRLQSLSMDPGRPDALSAIRRLCSWPAPSYRLFQRLAEDVNMNIQTIASAADFAAAKSRQQAAWSSGDYTVVGTTLQIVGESLCEAVDLRSNQRVLDVAAGNGNASLAAARRFALVVSTDYVGALLERARERAQAERLEIAFQEADAEDLPFADGSFNVVLSTFGVMFTPNQQRAATELAARLQERRQDRAGQLDAGWIHRTDLQDDRQVHAACTRHSFAGLVGRPRASQPAVRPLRNNSHQPPHLHVSLSFAGPLAQDLPNVLWTDAEGFCGARRRQAVAARSRHPRADRRTQYCDGRDSGYPERVPRGCHRQGLGLRYDAKLCRPHPTAIATRCPSTLRRFAGVRNPRSLCEGGGICVLARIVQRAGQSAKRSGRSDKRYGCSAATAF